MGDNCAVVRVLHYVSEDGADHFAMRFQKRSSAARARIRTRTDRVEPGSFGDHRSVGEGVCELRIDLGPG